MCQTTSDTYISTFPQKCHLHFSNLHAAFFLFSLLTFHNYYKPKFTTAFSRHILSNVFDQVFHIVAEFQKNAFDFFSLVTRNNYLNMYQIKIITKLPLSKSPSQWSRELSARNVYAQTPKNNLGQN